MFFCVAASAYSMPEQQQPQPQQQASSSRRAFLGRVPAAAAVAAASGWAPGPPHGASCFCASCGGVAPANAYERRDVGGPNASAETKAMNLQAYETNNRLERAGLKMEVN